MGKHAYQLFQIEISSTKPPAGTQEFGSKASSHGWYPENDRFEGPALVPPQPSQPPPVLAGVAPSMPSCRIVTIAVCWVSTWVWVTPTITNTWLREHPKAQRLWKWETRNHLLSQAAHELPLPALPALTTAPVGEVGVHNPHGPCIL